MSTTKTYEQLRLQFERSLKSLEEDITWYEKQDDPNARVLAKKRAVLANLKKYGENIEKVIQYYSAELAQVNVLHGQDEARLAKQCENLEAICLIHGIDDLAAWVGSGPDFNMTEAIILHKDGLIRIPNKLYERIEKLPADKRNYVIDLIRASHTNHS